MTFVALVRFCTELRVLQIRKICSVDSEQAAAMALRLCGPIPGRKLAVHFTDPSTVEIWKSEGVKAALNEAAGPDGHHITFEYKGVFASRL